MNRAARVRSYFFCWILLAVLCVILNILNTDWAQTNIVLGTFIVITLGILQGSVLEFPLQTIATIVMGGERRENKRASCDHLSIILNYNLLATSKNDIDECIETMYLAYIGNLSPKVSAVLVSATHDKELKEYEVELRDKYRTLIYDELYREGLALSQGRYGDIDDLHFEHVWKRYADKESDLFLTEHLAKICKRYSSEFMVVHRVSRVLKKCGQYQDLMLLSDGVAEAFSYCDKDLYGNQARKFGEKLFHESEDATNILNRQFDYTLVLDGDTGVPRASVFDLLEIAAAHPDKGIIQPSIKFHCTNNDTLYMHLESMRQSIYEPMTNAMTALFGQSGFFGKGLIQNKLYIKHVIGNKDAIIERVPIDVLSHDTFEAALLKPLYAGSVHLLEAPSYNYVTWSMRERRWNRGEIILATYFWKNAFGKPMRWLQKYSQKSKFNKTEVRTESKLDFITSYIAHSALRHMLMKPILLLYLFINYGVNLKSPNISIILVMFCILVFPKFAVCNRRTYKFVVLETVASILQFTPEALVGSIRICRALYANISLNAKWVPQRAVEEEFRKSNPFISGFRHLWGYSLISLISGIIVVNFLEDSLLVLVLLTTLLLLPIFTGFTSMKKGFSCLPKEVKRKESLTESFSKTTSVSLKEDSLATHVSSQMYQSLGQLWNGYTYKDTTFLLPSRKSSVDTLIDNTYNFGQKTTANSAQAPWISRNKQLTGLHGHLRKHSFLRTGGNQQVTGVYESSLKDSVQPLRTEGNERVAGTHEGLWKYSVMKSRTGRNKKVTGVHEELCKNSFLPQWNERNKHDSRKHSAKATWIKRNEQLTGSRKRPVRVPWKERMKQTSNKGYKRNFEYNHGFDRNKPFNGINRNLNGKTYYRDNYSDEDGKQGDIEKLFKRLNVLEQFTNVRFNT